MTTRLRNHMSVWPHVSVRIKTCHSCSTLTRSPPFGLRFAFGCPLKFTLSWGTSHESQKLQSTSSELGHSRANIKILCFFLENPPYHRSSSSANLWLVLIHCRFKLNSFWNCTRGLSQCSARGDGAAAWFKIWYAALKTTSCGLMQMEMFSWWLQTANCQCCGRGRLTYREKNGCCTLTYREKNGRRIFFLGHIGGVDCHESCLFSPG